MYATEIPTRFTDFADYWTPFLGGVGPAGTFTASLKPAARDTLSRALEARLPRGDSGEIVLTARAGVVRG